MNPLHKLHSLDAQPDPVVPPIHAGGCCMCQQNTRVLSDLSDDFGWKGFE